MRVPTSITLDYEAEKWSHLRIVLDGISNHIDAVGTLERVRVDITPQCITISDDGPGYQHELLSLLYSTKDPTTGTIGRFGEGLKLVAAASLRLGLEFEVRSMSWTATAVAEPVEIRTGDGSTRSVCRLCWEVRESDPIVGSITVIRSEDGLPEELVRTVQRWRDLFLPDEKRLVPHAWKEKRSRLFVRGVYVRDIDGYYFSYNLDCDINRDRDTVDLTYEVARFWRLCTDKDLLRAFLLLAHRYGRTSPEDDPGPPPAEVDLRIFLSKNGHLWVAAFKEIFGDNAVLHTDHFASYAAAAHGYLPVHMPETVTDLLHAAGVLKDSDVITDIERYGLREPSIDEELVIAKAVRIIRDAVPDIRVPPILVMDRAPTTLNGVYIPDKDCIGVRADLLVSFQKAMPTIVEEIAHANSRSRDLSREFESWLVQLASDLLIRIHEISRHRYRRYGSRGKMLPLRRNVLAQTALFSSSS
jgi:hypothetical protein